MNKQLLIVIDAAYTHARNLERKASKMYKSHRSRREDWMPLKELAAEIYEAIADVQREHFQ